MQIINSALATGDEPITSDAYTINGQPGDFYNCSKGTLLSWRSILKATIFIYLHKRPLDLKHRECTCPHVKKATGNTSEESRMFSF